MSMTNLGIWSLCFWDVICPNWWTLAMLLLAVIVFFVCKGIYAGKQINAKGALVHVGKRWQKVGYVIIAVAALVYIVEQCYIHTMTRKIVADRSKPQVSELQTLLRANEVYFSNLYRSGYDKYKGKFFRFRSDIIKNENFNIKEDVTFADARRYALEKKFSARIAADPNIKISKLYSAPSDSSMKRLVGDITMKRMGYRDGDNRKKFNAAVFAEFAKPEYKDVLPRLAAELKKTIASRRFNLAQFSNDNTRLWNEFCNLVNNNTGSIGEETIKSWAEEDAKMVARVFSQKASAAANDKATFNNLLPSAKSELVNFLNKYRSECFAPQNVQEILKEALRRVNSDPNFAGYQDNQMVEERKQAFWNAVNNLMLQRWREELDSNFIRGLEDKNDLLFSDDESELKKINKKWINIFNFNKCLNNLLCIANYLLNFFWFVVICIVVLFVFILRGKKIRNMGNVEKITRKLRG